MRSIVVLVDHRPSATDRVRAAASVAGENHARLTLLAPIGRPPLLAWCAPITPGDTPRRLQDEIERDCTQLLRERHASVPPDIGVILRGRRGRPRKALREEIISGGHDVVVLDSLAKGPLGWIERMLDRRLTRGLDASVLRPTNRHRDRAARLPGARDLAETR